MEQALVPQQQQQAVVSVGDNLTNLQRMGNLLAASGYFADAREMAQAAVKVMAGQELGIPPIASMMGINIIKGKIALGAHLIASRIKAHGYDFRFVRHDNTGCEIEFLSKVEAGKRRPLGVSSFTEDDAKAAGLMSDMYRKYPKNMYYSRAVSNGAKWYTPEVFGGAPVYTPEELGAEVDGDGNAVLPDPPPPSGPIPAPEPTVREIQRQAQQVDTGGAPVGIQQAANAVAERKLAEARDQQQAKPQQAPAPQQQENPDKLPTDFKVIMARFAEMKGVVGEERYYAILAEVGGPQCKHANQLGAMGNFQRAYEMLLAIARSGGEGVAA